MLSDLVCVPNWTLFALFIVGFLFGYFGDIFFSRD